MICFLKQKEREFPLERFHSFPWQHKVFPERGTAWRASRPPPQLPTPQVLAPAGLSPSWEDAGPGCPSDPSGGAHASSRESMGRTGSWGGDHPGDGRHSSTLDASQPVRIPIGDTLPSDSAAAVHTLLESPGWHLQGEMSGKKDCVTKRVSEQRVHKRCPKMLACCHRSFCFFLELSPQRYGRASLPFLWWNQNLKNIFNSQEFPNQTATTSELWRSFHT